jgi:hypothetical protein
MQLIRAGQLPWTDMAAVSLHGRLECASGKQVEQLREDGLAVIHRRILPATPANTSDNR